MDMTVSGPFVIIGAGPAGIRAAEILRQHAPDADILLIGEEPHLPYQRPPLSKAYLTDRLSAAQLYLKPEAFFTEQRIGLKLGCAATRIDRSAKLVELADGEKVPYGRLLLATGCRYRRSAAHPWRRPGLLFTEFERRRADQRGADAGRRNRDDRRRFHRIGAGRIRNPRSGPA